MSLWYPRLASERVLRACALEGPFALTIKEKNANRLYCLNEAAEQQGLHRGMPYSDARAFCPELQSTPAHLQADQHFLAILRRWATRYCPWVGLEGRDGLVLDITGSSHLFANEGENGEETMLADMRARLERAGLTVQIGLADTRGAAWALAHYGEGRAKPRDMLPSLAALPVAALQLDETTCVALQRLGLRQIGDVVSAPRAPLARRFGSNLMKRLDQVLGHQPEAISPIDEPPHYGVRMTLPEPIGLVEDVMAGTGRLLMRLCDKLQRQEAGARIFCLSLRRVDKNSKQIELQLARPMSDSERILPFFERHVAKIDAGFGIDQLRLEALMVEDQPARQMGFVSHHPGKDRLDDLISQLGTRVGLENIVRFLPADSHIPERSFLVVPAAFSEPEGKWIINRPRPIRLFTPEPIAAVGGKASQLPHKFRWRGLTFTTRRSTGPERIAPEWWLQDEAWISGLRDYWHVETAEGRRLWMFYTPQKPGWFVQGEFA